MIAFNFRSKNYSLSKITNLFFKFVNFLINLIEILQIGFQLERH